MWVFALVLSVDLEVTRHAWQTLPGNPPFADILSPVGIAPFTRVTRARADDDDGDDLREAVKRLRKEAKRAAKRARKEAKREAKQARKEAERAAKQARKEAEREAKQARKEAEREAKQARKEAEREAKRARKKAKRARKQAREDRELTEEEERRRHDKGKEASDEDGESRTAKRDEERDKKDEKDEKDKKDKKDEKNKDDWSMPPGTLVGMVEKIFGDSKTRRKKKAIAPVRRNKRPRPRGVRVAHRHPRLPAFKGHEIVAIGFGHNALSRAKRLGFRVHATSNLVNIGLSATRLITPKGMNVIAARRLLRRKFPGRPIDLNRVYHIYRAAKGEPTSRRKAKGERRHGGAPVERVLPGPCGTDRCFAPSIIHWTRALRSCGAGLRIGIIDTAVDNGHPVFRGRGAHVGDFIPAGLKSAPRWHGTSVLAILAGDRHSAVPGLLPDAEYYAANIFYLDRKGRVQTDTFKLLRALDWMQAFRVKVVNMSFTGPPDPLVETALRRMSRMGTIFVAAAGNGGPTAGATYPAAYAQVVSVTAVDRQLRVYRHANRGAFIDVAAPGVHIWTAEPNARHAYRTGTSFAAPYVTAILAAAWRHGVHDADPARLIKALGVQDLGPRGRDRIYGRGLLLAPKRCSDPSRIVRR